ncbi:hypothetical protein JRQ81_018673 [Phrynocephalus forsythii]|uniref:DNA-directed RNA polymerase subunit n=1 Tax=Phrynocephalus forsythii TaxID=171643 RepID=A0A9Q1AYZ7_9SAUR|nr:hypothetical protein JRQ81_018673 [Phrynocephalus forsythii]
MAAEPPPPEEGKDDFLSILSQAARLAGEGKAARGATSWLGDGGRREEVEEGEGGLVCERRSGGRGVGGGGGGRGGGVARCDRYAMAEEDSSSPAAAAPAATPLGGVELPSFEAVRALAESRYSCLVATPHRRHVALPPRFLHRKRTGICAQLDAELRRYSESFQGVPVAYDDIKITKELGDIIDDIGAIHLNIEANFVVFQPKAGKKLVGIINKVAPSHVGCLVHGCFNASIPKPDHVSADEWKNFGFQIGNRLVFKVVQFDSDAAGVFCIRGRLCRSSIEEDMPKEKHKKKQEQHCDTQNGHRGNGD